MTQLQDTPVGVLPVDWNVEALGDLFSVAAGGDWDPANSVKIRDARHPYPVVANALTPGATQGYCSYYRAKGDTLTITGRGEVGRAVYRAEPYVPIVRLLALTPSRDLSSRFFAEYINARVHFSLESTGVPQLTAPQVRPYLLAVPPADEQKRIAGVLQNIDHLIASFEKLIAKKQAIKQGMMQQLLTGRTRLPGFSEVWRETSLSEIGACYRGVGYDPDADLSGSDKSWTVRLLRSNNVREGDIDFAGLQYVHERRVAGRQFLVPDDIVICMANGSRALVGKAAFFSAPADAHRYTFGAFMGAFRTLRQKADARYIAELMQSKVFRDWIELILSGSSINNLRPGDVESFKTPMPDVAEQTAIADVLTDSGHEIRALQHRLVKARAIKQGMMQQLLTGRVRLPMEPRS